MEKLLEPNSNALRKEVLAVYNKTRDQFENSDKGDREYDDYLEEIEDLSKRKVLVAGEVAG